MNKLPFHLKPDGRICDKQLIVFQRDAKTNKPTKARCECGKELVSENFHTFNVYAENGTKL